MMFDLFDAYRNLVKIGSSPALTWYAKDGRVELSGKVAANHLAKICTYLSEDVWLSPGVEIQLDLPPAYKQVLWGLGAMLADSRVTINDVDSPALPHSPEVLITSRSDGESIGEKNHNKACEVLALDVAPLAFSWSGEPLPPRVRDATAEVMGSSDTLLQELSPAASNAHDWLVCGENLSRNDEALLSSSTFMLPSPTASQALAAFVFASVSARKRLVIIEDSSRIASIKKAEGLH